MILEKLLGDYLPEIIENTNILSIVGKKVELKKIGKDYFGKCPFCDGKNFSVNEEKKTFNCVDCKKSGNIINFIEEIRKKERNEVSNETKPYLSESFDILREIFPDRTDEEHRRLFNEISALLYTKVVLFTTNKSYLSYRDNGRFLKEFRFLCEFVKSEKDTDEDAF